MAIDASQAIESFLEELSIFKAHAVFNPWGENCEWADVHESFHVRRRNLRTVLYACAAAEEVDLWVGRDLGWRGGRRTGVPFVDEYALTAYAQSIDLTVLEKATASAAMKERTATEIHEARVRVGRKLFFWNVFPFHPHVEGDARSNRMHTRREREIGTKLLEQVLGLLPLRYVITVGNDATSAAREAGVNCLHVRHPSYGGQHDFHRQIDEHYGLQGANEQLELFA